jgi:hypothetical protein
VPNVLSPGFGGNMDNMAGQIGGVTLSQLAYGEWRARSIYSGNAGALIRSIHVTPRDATSAGPQFPAAGMFPIIGFLSNSQLDVAQYFFPDAQHVRDIAQGGDVFLHTLRSTLGITDLFFPDGIFVKPNTFAHILCVTPRTPGNLQIATDYTLSVTGRYLEGDGPKFHLR